VSQYPLLVLLLLHGDSTAVHAYDLHSLTVLYVGWLFVLMPYTPYILAVNFFFLFQLNAHNMLNPYIYHLLPLYVSVFVTPSSGRSLRYLYKNYMLFALFLHMLCYKM